MSIVRRAGLQLVIGVLVSVSLRRYQGSIYCCSGRDFVAGYINVAIYGRH